MKDGGCAFPFNAGEFGIEPSSGMSLRDWFAGQALSAMSEPFAKKEKPEHRAKAAYALADAMLVERGKESA